VPAIPLDIAPHVEPVPPRSMRWSACSGSSAARSQLQPPASLDAVLAAERAGQLQLPTTTVRS